MTLAHPTLLTMTSGKDLDEVKLTLEPMVIFLPGLAPAGRQLLAAIDNFRKAARDLAKQRGST